MSQVASGGPSPSALATSAGTTTPASEPAGDLSVTPLQTETAPPGTAPDRAEDVRKAAFEAATQGKPYQAPASDDLEDDAITEPADRATNGRFVPKTPGIEGEDKPKTAKTSATPPIVAAQEREDYVLASRALRRDQWTEAEIKALPPERVIAMGAKRAKDQALLDNALRRAAQVERGGLADTAGNGHTPASREGTPRTNRDPLAEFLDNEGEPTGQPEGEPQETRALTETEQIRQELLADRALSARDSLTRELPQLKDDRVAKAVLQQMDRLDPDGLASQQGREAVTQLMREAAYVVLGPSLNEQARNTSRNKNHAARTGQPDLGGDARPPTKAADPDSIRRAAFEAAKKSSSPEEARSKMNRTLGRQVAS